MEFKGTKGKWEIDITPPYHEPKCSTLEIYSDEKTSVWICKVQNNGVIESEEGTANAQLIASAPEMFELLSKLVRECQIKDISRFKEAKQLLTKITTI
jgi:hypothetical protein